MIPSAVKDDPNKDWATQAQEIIEDYLNKHSHTEFIDTAVLNDAEGLTASLSIVQSLALLRIPNLVVDEKIKLSKPQEDKFKALKAVYESDQETQSLQEKEPREQAGCLIKFLNGRMNQTEFPKLCSDILFSSLFRSFHPPVENELGSFEYSGRYPASAFVTNTVELKINEIIPITPEMIIN